MTGRRLQEVSPIIKAAAEAVPLRSVCQCPPGEIAEECGAMGRRRLAKRRQTPESVISPACGADRGTVLAGVRNLAGELDQLEKRSQAKQGGAK
jgi:hypothetical protein